MNNLNQELLDYASCNDDTNETVYSYYNLSTVSPAELYIHAAVLSGIILLGLLANLTVFFLVACNRKLRHRSTITSMNIVIVDFLLSIFYHGVALTSLILGNWTYGEDNDDVEICRFFSFTTPYFIYVRWIALCLISVDRFLTVKFPFHYERNNKLFLILLTTCVWFIPVALGFVLIYVGKPTFRPNVPTCVVSCVNTQALCGPMNILLFSITFIVGCLIPSVLYTWMYCKGRSLKHRVSMGTFNTPTLESVGRAKSLSYRNHSNEVSHEKRTLITLILLYLSVLLTSMPQYLVVLLRGIRICAFFRIPISVHFMIADIFFFSTVLDPLVLMKNQEFRYVIFHILDKLKQRFHCYIHRQPSTRSIAPASLQSQRSHHSVKNQPPENIVV